MRLHLTLLAVAGLSAALVCAPARAGDLRHTAVVDVVRRVRGAVVNIHSERTVQAPASDPLFAVTPSQNRVNGMGTGIIIDERGYIITNQHVVDDVNLIRVRLADGTSVGARVVARDNEADLALLKIDVDRRLPVMPLGTASDLMVGETVVAIGNAYGYDHTVTTGVVSAVHRDVTLNKEMSYKALIQTDASINPGNSGGPLLNINGELVGVNVAIRAGAQGIGFAIPVDTMIRVAADMLRGRTRNGIWHGLVVRDEVRAAAEPAAEPGSGAAGEKKQGQPPASSPPPPRATVSPLLLVVERVEPNSPAARAGAQRGDVVTAVADRPVNCSLDLERAFLDCSAGEHVSVTVRRERPAVTVGVKVLAADSTPPAEHAGQDRVALLDLVLEVAERATPQAAELIWRKLGLRLQPVSSDLVSRTNSQLHGGLAVLEVRPEGAAGKAGIQRGDILVGLHQWEMLTLDNVVFVLNHPDLASFNPLRFYIVRSGQVHRGWIQQLD